MEEMARVSARPGLRPDELFDLKFLRDARLSPDGRRVAYVVSRTGDDEQLEIWIADSAGGNAQCLPYAGNASAPRWSPDGRWLAFVGEARLHLAEVPRLLVCDPLTPHHLEAQGAPTWSPDGTRLAISLLERFDMKGPRRITNNNFRAEGYGFVDTFHQRVYEVDRATGALRCFTPAAKMCSYPEWSPCGRRVLFFLTEDAVPYAEYSPRLLTVDVSSGELTEVLSDRWFISCAHWLPGGNHIAVSGARDSTLTIPVMSLWVVDRDGTHAQLRTAEMSGSLGFHIHHDMPVWELQAGNAFVVLDRHTALATVQKGGCVEVWRIALTGAPSIERVLTGERSCIVLDAKAAANIMVFAVTDLSSPTELARATLDTFEEQRITALNEEVLAGWPTMHTERLVFESPDGVPVEGWFMAGAGQRPPLPTVMFIHGGPFSATGHAFRYDFTMLASHGFGVLFVNFRGSSGYGEAFVRAVMGDWGERAYPDHMAAVDAAVALGRADAKRLGVWGASHGGFATCWIVGHTDRFKAAVAEASFANFATLYYLSDIPEVFRRDLGGRPHEIADVYRARSAITYAHRCTTPTMLLHGEDDLRCPISEAEQFHRLLGDVGCTTELFRIPRCSHTGDSTGPLSVRRAQNEALLRWFKEHL